MFQGFLRAIALNVLSWFVELLGLVVVWFALPYAKAEGETKPFTQHPERGAWRLVRLPRWALWWDNQFDGLYGDKRGWWANEWQGKHTTRYVMWRWAATRNPANYFSRNLCGVDVSKLRIFKAAGTIDDEGTPPYRGWLLLVGFAEGRKVYPRFYAEYAITKTHGLMFDLGWKIKLSHNGRKEDAPESERIKGIVFTGSIWKNLT